MTTDIDQQIAVPPTEYPVRPRRRTRTVFIIVIAGLLLLAVVLLSYTYRVFVIPSSSMAPTLPEGSRVIVNRLVYHLSPIRHGDLIVFRDRISPLMASGGNPAMPARAGYGLKRVIALPGDTILIRSGRGVFRNGMLLTESYTAELPAYDWPPTTSTQREPQPYRVPAGHCFVLGDNRNMSLDSHAWMDPATNRHYPDLPLDAVVGRVGYILPLRKL